MPDVILNGCRERFGPAPRRFGWYDRTTYLHVFRPAWCKTDDLRVYFENRERLLREGIIVWGHVVQANEKLFRREPDEIWGGHNLPGEVVYCDDPDREISVYDLGNVAHALFALKGKPQDDREKQFLSDHLANELTRVFGVPIPEVLSPEFPCRLSTTYFERDHLPGNCLRRNYFPLLIASAEPRAVMVLPSRYWPASLVALWETPKRG